MNSSIARSSSCDGFGHFLVEAVDSSRTRPWIPQRFRRTRSLRTRTMRKTIFRRWSRTDIIDEKKLTDGTFSSVTSQALHLRRRLESMA